MQQQQLQQVMTEYRQLMQARAKSTSPAMNHSCRRWDSWSSGRDKRDRNLAELKDDLADLKDQIEAAQSDGRQQFADLHEYVQAVESHSTQDMGVAKEELQLKQCDLAQAHEELKTEVAELGKKLAAEEGSLRVTAPAFTPSFISTGSECPLEIVIRLTRISGPHPMMVGLHGMPTALDSRC